MDTIKSKLLKILALTDSPVPGESEAAKRMLRDLCKKYHIHPDTLLSPIMQCYRFRHRGGRDRILVLLCVHYIVRGDRAVRYSPRSFDFELTRAEQIDISDMLRHYRAALRKDAKDFFTAFVSRHNLGVPSTDNVEIDPERLRRLLEIMRGINSETWIRPAARLSAASAAQ